MVKAFFCLLYSLVICHTVPESHMIPFPLLEYIEVKKVSDECRLSPKMVWLPYNKNGSHDKPLE